MASSAAAAAGWSAGSRLSAGSDNAKTHLAKTLETLSDLASSIQGFSGKLQTKEQMNQHQRFLEQNEGPVERTGGPSEEAHFRVGERVGEGTFCAVFRADLLPEKKGDASRKGTVVAVKFELRKNDSTQLRNEYRMYKKLIDCPGIVKTYSFGEVHFHKVLVMELLGPSLEVLFQDCGRKFSITTVAMVAKQMLARIQTIHKVGIIFRDIKPENFLTGLPQTDVANTIYLVDFGMAKFYIDPETKEHIPYGEAQSLSGTARYMSINAHCRRSQSRRDDLEALGHVFMYFLRGSLPWQGTKAAAGQNNDQRYDIMCEKKQAVTIADLCSGFPSEFSEYLAYTRGLPFNAKPDYDYMQGLFSKVLADRGDAEDAPFDWMKLSGQGGQAEPHTSPSQPAQPAQPAPPAQPELEKALTADTGEPEDAAPAPNVQTSVPMALLPPAELNPAGRPPLDQRAGSHKKDTTPGALPVSPTGKRRRSDFASDLVPPLRVRHRKTTFAFYDSEAQKALYTLYRDVMAKRYAFHRAAGGSIRGTPTTSAATTAATAAAAVTAAAASGADSAAIEAATSFMGRSTLGGFSRSASRMPAPVVSAAFSDTLDRTLGSIISELEDMSDKLLLGGDWTGVSRVQGWFDELAAAVQEEIQRLQHLQQQQEQGKGSQVGDSGSEAGAQGRGSRQTGDVVYDMDDLLLKAGRSPPATGRSHGGSSASGSRLRVGFEEGYDSSLLLADDDNKQGKEDRHVPGTREKPTVFSSVGSSGGRAGSSMRPPPQPRLNTPILEADSDKDNNSGGSGSGSAAGEGGKKVQKKQKKESLVGGSTIAQDDGDNDDDDDDDDGNDGNDTFALVYRTASGTRRVLRMPRDAAP